MELVNLTNDLQDNLLRAVYANNTEKICSLLGARADVSAADGPGHQTPLHWASRRGYEEAVSTLLTHRAPLEAKGQDGATPLHVAAEYDAGSVVAMLLKAGSSSSSLDKNGRNPWHLAADGGCEAAIAALVSLVPLPTRLQEFASMNRRGETALTCAAARGHSKVVQSLLQARADHTRANKRQLLPLQLAVRSNHTDTVSVLLNAGASTILRAADGATLLHEATASASVVQLLLGHGAAVEARTNDGRSALHAAATHGHSEAVKTLGGAGADLNAQDSNGQSALMLASVRGHAPVVESLLCLRANLEVMDSSGQKALHLAAAAGQAGIVELLLASKADVDCLNRENRTPIELALTSKQDAVVLALLRAGANIPQEVADTPTIKDLMAKIAVQDQEKLKCEAISSFSTTEPHISSSCSHPKAVSNIFHTQSTQSPTQFRVEAAPFECNPPITTSSSPTGATGPTAGATGPTAGATADSPATVTPQPQPTLQAASRRTAEQAAAEELFGTAAPDEDEEDEGDSYSQEGFDQDEEEDADRVNLEEEDDSDSLALAVQAEAEVVSEVPEKPSSNLLVEDPPSPDTAGSFISKDPPAALSPRTSSQQDQDAVVDLCATSLPEGSQKQSRHRILEIETELSEEDVKLSPRTFQQMLSPSRKVLLERPDVDNNALNLWKVRSPSHSPVQLPTKELAPQGISSPSRQMSIRSASPVYSDGGRKCIIRLASCSTLATESRCSSSESVTRKAVSSAFLMAAKTDQQALHAKETFLKALQMLEPCGSIAQAWLKHVDRKRSGLVKFKDFCHVLADIGFTEDSNKLWHILSRQEHCSQGLGLDSVSEDAALLLASVGRWCRKRCGSVLKFFAYVDQQQAGSVSNRALLHGFDRLGFFKRSAEAEQLVRNSDRPQTKDEFLERVIPLLDLSCSGTVIAEDFLVLEADAKLRRQLRARLEQSREIRDRGGVVGEDLLDTVTLTKEECADLDIPTDTVQTDLMNNPFKLPLTSPVKNDASKLLFNLAKQATALGGKHWKQSGLDLSTSKHPEGPLKIRRRRLSIPKLKEPTTHQEERTLAEPFPEIEAISAARALKNVQRVQSLPSLRKTAAQEVAEAMTAAAEAKAAAEFVAAIEDGRRLKEKVKLCYKKKNEQQFRSLPLLPASGSALGGNVRISCGMWQSASGQKHPRLASKTHRKEQPSAPEDFFSRGQQRQLFDRYCGGPAE